MRLAITRTVCLLAAWPLASLSADTPHPVTSYRDGFSLVDQDMQNWASGWRYFWNAPDGWTTDNSITGDLDTGAIGDVGSFMALQKTTNSYTPDGDANGGNNQPAAYLKLTATGGHPGKQTDASNVHARYAIAAYKVSQSGQYSIENSYLSKTSANNDGLEALTFTHGFTAKSAIIAPTGQTVDFDAELGYLRAGEIIHVAVGPGETAYSDTFLMDFDLVRYEGTVVGHYRDDFSSDSAPINWSYLWNAPVGWVDDVNSGEADSGFIGLPDSYQPMQSTSGVWTPDGDTTYTNNDPAGYLKLTALGGHPGKSSTSDELRHRYAIAAFTTPSAGYYAIEESFLHRPSTSAGEVDVLVYPDISEPILKTSAGPNQQISFDAGIGYLEAGATIYVAFGPGDSPVSDAFYMDFKIVRYDRDSLQEQLDAAVAASRSEVIFTPGRYYSKTPNRAVRLQNYNGLDIIADGVELYCQNRDRAFEIDQCDQVSLSGLTINYDPPLFAQGVIETLDDDEMTVRLSKGYPYPIESDAFSGVTYSPAASGQTPVMRPGCYTRYPSKINPIVQQAPDLFYIPLSNPISDQAQVGDHFTITLKSGIPHAVAILDSQNIALRDVTLHGSSTFSVLAKGGPGGLSFQRVTIEPRPTPLLAEVPPLLSSSADGIHVKDTGGNITIEDCTFRYLGDDCVALSASYFGVVGVSGNQITVATKYAHELNQGDELAIYQKAAKTRATATVNSITASTLSLQQAQQVWNAHFNANDTLNYGNLKTITLSSSVACQPGDFIANVDRANQGFSVSSCVIDNTRARGILVKASGSPTAESLIANNAITNTWLAGVQLRPEPGYWMEADFSHDVGIVGNLLTDCGLSPNAYGAMRVDVDGIAWSAAHGHQDLRIENNVITGAPGCSLYVQYADGVDIKNNQFHDSHHDLWKDATWNRSVVWLDYVNDVLIQGNTVSGADSANQTGPLVGDGSHVSNVQNTGGLVIIN